MVTWFRNVWTAVFTLLKGMYVTLATMLSTYRRKAFTEVYEYPEVPVPVKARYRARFCPPTPKRFRQNAGFSCGTVRSAQLLVPMLIIALLRQGNWK